MTLLHLGNAYANSKAAAQAQANAAQQQMLFQQAMYQTAMAQYRPPIPKRPADPLAFWLAPDWGDRQNRLDRGTEPFWMRDPTPFLPD